MNKEFEKIFERLILESSSCKVYKLIKPNIEDVSEFNAYKKCIEIVKEVAAEYNGGWIPCSERLPEENKDGWTHLILSIKTGEVIFGFWHNEEMGFCKHFRDGVCRVGGVIAWQPLPEPYKESD